MASSTQPSPPEEEREHALVFSFSFSIGQSNAQSHCLSSSGGEGWGEEAIFSKPPQKLRRSRFH
jgi:hypothetical protein